MSETVNETMNDVTMTDKLTNNDMASNVTGPASSGSEGRSANPSVAMPRVVSIVGPTASGKTGLGIAVARALAERGERAEIVNADAYQMYRGMDIGTAKPTPEEMQGVPHHMIDIADPAENYSVSRYAAQAAACVDDILARGKLPIVVGGTGLYIDSLIAGRTFADGTADTALRQELSERYDEIGGEGLLGELRNVDPERAARLHPADKKRIVRAMEVYILTGKTITQHRNGQRHADGPARRQLQQIAQAAQPLLLCSVYEGIERADKYIIKPHQEGNRPAGDAGHTVCQRHAKAAQNRITMFFHFFFSCHGDRAAQNVLPVVGMS